MIILDARMTCDREWKVTSINVQAEELLKCTGRELLGTMIWEQIPGSMGTPLYHRAMEAMQAQKLFLCEYYSTRLKLWLQANIYPDPDGIAIYLRDITQYKQAGAALQKSEERFRTSVDNLLDSFYIHSAIRDASGQIVDFRVEYANKAASTSTRTPREEQIGKGLFAMFPWLRQTGLFEEFCKVVETGEPFNTDAFVFPVEYQGHHLKRIAEIRVVRLEDGLISAWRDITERKETEEALKASETKLKRLVESNIIGVTLIENGYIVEANDAFLEMVGYTREDLNEGPLNWWQMTPAEYIEADQNALQEMARSGVSPLIEKEYYRKDGSRIPVLLRSALLSEHSGVCFILDISRPKELERRKDAFISIASHELKTPLTSLKAMLQLARRRIDKQPGYDARDYLTKMDAQINTLTRLVNDLLNVSKIQAGKLEYLQEIIDIDELVYEIVEDFQHLATAHHRISVTGTTQQKIVGDRDHLRQVFANLLTNALKYSPQAGQVEVSLSASHDTITVSVRDYGIGIPKEQQEKIFECFYRANAAESAALPGLGIGLYIAQEIVRQHGGTIRVESVSGQGSTFSVVLPLGQEDRATENHVPPKSSYFL
jgi:PAS domain S-box-containing protein